MLRMPLRRRCLDRGARNKRALATAVHRAGLEMLESRTLLSISVTGIPSWIEQGPAPLNNGNNVILNDPNDSASGAINEVAVDPANANRIFVATVGGGAWSTTNGLAANPTWNYLTGSLPSQSLGAITIDPLNANTIWIGTGRFSNGFGDGASRPGLFRSDDSGATWSAMASPTFVGSNIQEIVPTTIGSGDTQVILLATRNGGVFRSIDGGASFNALGAAAGLPGGAGASDLIADPGNANRFYAALPGQGVYISTNGGVDWSPVNTGLTGLAGSSRIELSIHNNGGNNVIYAGVVNNSGTLSNIFWSTNQGGNWSHLGAVPNATPGGQGGGNFAILADPNDQNVVFISGDRGNSNNAGETFRGDRSSNTWVSIDNANANGTAPHPDVRDMVFDSAGNIVRVDDGGIYRLVDPNNSGGNREWFFAGGNIAAVEFYSIAYDEVNDTLSGGTQDNCSPEQNSSGSFTWTSQLGGDGTFSSVDNWSLPGFAIHYASTQNMGTLRRQVYDNTHTPVTSDATLVVAGTGGVAWNKSQSGTRVFDSTNQFAQPYAINAIDGTRLLLATNFLYESTDRGDTLTSVGGLNNLNANGIDDDLDGVVDDGDEWSPAGSIGACNPRAVNNKQGRPIVYGGRAGGVDNADLIWMGAGGNLLLRTSGSGLPSVVSGYTGAAVLDLAVDPENYNTLFVLDVNNTIWMTTNTGTSFTNVTGNLGSLSPDLRALVFAEEGGSMVLLASGDKGVFRTINPVVGAAWNEFGGGIPDLLVKDLTYDAADDVLIAGTWGRGAWTISSASDSFTSTGVLIIDGDTDFPGQDDIIKLIIDAANPSLLDVFLNGEFLQTPLAAVQQINVNGLAGNDSLTVDSSNGLITIANGIRFDGGTGSDVLQLVQTGGTTHASDVYSVGPALGQGSSVISDPGVIQSVTFENLEPVIDLVAAATLTVNGTPSDNAISYGAGAVTANGKVSIDNFETIEFSNKTSLVINGLAGSDAFSLNNPNTPTGLTGIGVNGADPSGNDTLVVNGIAGALDNIRFLPTDDGAGSIVNDSAAQPAIDFTGFEHLAIALQQLDGDGVRIQGTAGDDKIEFLAGAAPGTGTFIGTLDMNNATGVGPFAMTETSFTGTNAASNDVDVNFVSPGGTDTFIFNATAGNDTIQIGPGDSGGTEFRDTINGQVVARVEVSNIASATARGLAGNDIFNIAPSPLSAVGPLVIEQSDASNAGVANLTGSGSATQVTLGSTVTVVGGGLGTVTLIGNASTNLSGVGALTIVGGAGPDAFNVAVGAGGNNTTTVTDGTVFTATNTGSVDLVGAAGAATNSVAVSTAGVASVNYSPTGPSAGTILANATTITLSNVHTFNYDANGGDSALSITGNANNNQFTLTPGATDDAGIAAMGSNLPVNFKNLGTGGSVAFLSGGGVDSLTYLGTNANDIFNIDSSGLGAVINLNNRVPATTSAGFGTLTINGQAGDDVVNLLPAVQSSPFTTINVNGGSQASAAGDRLVLVGTAASETYDLNGQNVVAGGTTINGTGLEEIRLDAGGGTDLITYTGTPGVTENVALNATPTPGSTQLVIPNVALYTLTSAEQYIVNGNNPEAGEDTFTVSGTNADDTFDINANAEGTDADPVLQLSSTGGTLLTVLNYTNIATLNVRGLDGADVFNVHTGPTQGRTLYLDGGSPTAKKKSTDKLHIFYVGKRPKIIQSAATQNPGSGLVDLLYDTGARTLVQFADIEDFTISKE